MITDHLLLHQKDLAILAESSYIKTTLYDLSQRLQQPNAASSFTVNQSRSSVVQAWNNVLNNSPIDFGDVIGLSVNRFAVANQNYNGANTWVTRNEEPVREAIGWPEALYMMTPSGFQLLRVNQLTTNKLTFAASGSTEEILQRMTEFFNSMKNLRNRKKKSFRLI